MINIETKDGATKVSIEGNIGTLVADTQTLLGAIHTAIKEESEKDADYFKWVVRNIVINVCFTDKGKVIGNDLS